MKKLIICIALFGMSMQAMNLSRRIAQVIPGASRKDKLITVGLVGYSTLFVALIASQPEARRIDFNTTVLVPNVPLKFKVMSTLSRCKASYDIEDNFDGDEWYSAHDQSCSKALKEFNYYALADSDFRIRNLKARKLEKNTGKALCDRHINITPEEAKKRLTEFILNKSNN